MLRKAFAALAKLGRWLKCCSLSDQELMALIKGDDAAWVEVAWTEIICRVKDKQKFMEIVIDAKEEFRDEFRLKAGKLLLRELSEGPLMGYEWFEPEEGRVAWLILIGRNLPELRPQICEAVSNFYPDEVRHFVTCSAW